MANSPNPTKMCRCTGWKECMQSMCNTSKSIHLSGLKCKCLWEIINLCKWIPFQKLCSSWSVYFLCCKKSFKSIFKNKFQASFHLHHKQWLFFCSTSTDSLAPPIKQKARFKIKDAKCHLRPRSKEKTKDAGKQAVLGM